MMRCKSNKEISLPLITYQVRELEHSIFAYIAVCYLKIQGGGGLDAAAFI